MNDRERLIDILYEGFYISPGNDIKGTAQKAADYLISHGVTVQKHGRWVWDAENECWLCSTCKQSALNNYRGNSADSNYCPNCGAKMDGEA